MSGKADKPTRAAGLGIQIAPDAVRVVALGSGRRPALLGHAEVSIESPEQTTRALLEAVEQTGCVGPARAVLLGAGTTHMHLRLPKMGRGEFREALQLKIGETLGEPPEGFLMVPWVSPVRDDALRDVVVLLVPREPLESWAAALASAGCPLRSATTPAGLLFRGDAGPDLAGTMWAHVGGTRTCLTILRGSEIALTRELPRHPHDDDDPMAAIERRLADFQEVERSIVYDRQAAETQGIRELRLCGAAEEIEPFREQILPPLRELGIAIELDDAWAGIERGEGIPQGAVMRLAMAAQAAQHRRPILGIVPQVTRTVQRSSRNRLVAIAASAGLALAALVLAANGRMVRDTREVELRLAEEQLEMIDGETAPETAEARPGPEIRPDPVADWSPILREIGLLAAPGVDYRKIELSHDGDGPRLRVEGSVDTRDRARNGQALAELFDGLLASPYARGLPAMSVAADPAGSGSGTGFAIEGGIEDASTDGGPS